MRWRLTVLVASIALAVGASAPAALGAPPDHSHAGGVHVLRVGTWHGIAGQYWSIQAAVNAAQPGDWVLVAPGDYHEQGDAEAGVMITTPNVHVRGLDRNGVVVDGTRSGATQCSSARDDQGASGRNGVEVFEADGVSVENLTACNFLNGGGGGGNEIWWNGGDGTGTQNLGPFLGAYLSATSTFWPPDRGHRAEYGIFVSNTTGPGTIAHTYASNMADSSYYVGACPDCRTVLDDAHAQYSALGYSGTNSGGNLIIRNSEFDQNKTGVSTNSQNNDDVPSPQDGICPADGIGPTGSHSCWLFTDNFVHDNNSTTAPSSGSAELGPPGTGIVISGGRNDTVMHNRFSNNGSWAVLVVPFLDLGTPPPIAHCEGGTDFLGGCFFGPWGNEVATNTFENNGGFGNPTNGDLADLSDLHDPGNCWHDNTDPAGVTSAPPDLQLKHAVCGVPNAGEAVLGSELSNQVLCATELLGPCDPSVGNYPRTTTVVMQPLAPQPTMPDPCAGVPANAWCPGGQSRHGV